MLRVLVGGLALAGLLAEVGKAQAGLRELLARSTRGRPLFNGKNLDGWKACEYFGEGVIQVKDGMIVINRGKIMSGVVYTRKDFPTMNYELSLEARKVEGDDFFCTTTFPVGKSFCSLVVGGWGGGVVGLSNVDFQDASTNETRKDMTFKAGQWYRIRIRVSQKRIEAWIDREKVIDLDTTERDLSIRVECNACKPLGIATWKTSANLRDLRVRPLTEAEKKQPRS